MTSNSMLPPAADELVVVIPCHDEAPAIAQVVADFRMHLPHARLIVIDNASSGNDENIPNPHTPSPNSRLPTFRHDSAV